VSASVRVVSSGEPAPASAGPVIRAATEADAAAIRDLIRAAWLNPRDLDWRRFLVADDGGTIVACAQVRTHDRGSRELASVAVMSSRQGEGIGRAISEAAIAREPVRPLFLYTESRTVRYWEKFGFRVIEGDEIPEDLRGSLRPARVAMAAVSIARREHYAISVMRRDGF
jgi:N-acetylglutamate synthase-like GNAT family acetyltransferase